MDPEVPSALQSNAQPNVLQGNRADAYTFVLLHRARNRRCYLWILNGFAIQAMSFPVYSHGTILSGTKALGTCYAMKKQLKENSEEHFLVRLRQ